MRIHLPALPGRSLSAEENPSCAYSNKVRRFREMLEPRGHAVLTYEAADWDELDFEPGLWSGANKEMARRIEAEIQEGDLIGIIAGECQRALVEELPGFMAVEYGVGYGGTCTPFRAFESYAWMHTVMGAQQGAHSADGNFYDRVIPNYYPPEEFPQGEGEGGYALYMGRLTARKGVQIAEEACKRANVPLKIAGEGDYTPNHGELLGVVGPEERARLMGDAACLIAPTIYVEPFGGVVAEAQLCGTPVVTTDWGAYTETVDHGRAGFRCRTLAEFSTAVRACQTVFPEDDRYDIRSIAQSRWSFAAVAPQFEKWFEDLASLNGDGWYS